MRWHNANCLDMCVHMATGTAIPTPRELPTPTTGAKSNAAKHQRALDMCEHNGKQQNVMAE
eukprot:9810529-Lingulodinium_polyedra.AAC.1